MTGRSSSRQLPAQVTSTQSVKKRSSADNPLLHCITLQQYSREAQRPALHPTCRKTILAWQLRLPIQVNIVVCSKNSLSCKSCKETTKIWAIQIQHRVLTESRFCLSFVKMIVAVPIQGQHWRPKYNEMQGGVNQQNAHTLTNTA